MFTPITEPTQVPQVGSGYETPFFDLKAHPNAYKVTRGGKRVWDDFELAKDAAAFANASGGTLLIGATENRANGTCSGHTPFSVALATRFEVVLKNALEKRCRPRPLVECNRLPFGAKVMLAVSVWAFPGQAVAVQIKGSKRDGYGGDSYVFPYRLLSHTTYLPVEQIPMLLTPDVRRVAILLSTLRPDTKIRVHPKMIVESDQHTHPFDMKFVRVDELRNCLIVKDTNGRESGVPLDQTSAWYETDGCHIQCDRRLLAR